MRAHSQTIDHRSRVGVGANVDGMDWFQRLCQWLKEFSHRPYDIEPVGQYGTWDPKREQYRPMKADAAVDLVAARNGMSWTSRIYSASI